MQKGLARFKLKEGDAESDRYKSKREKIADSRESGNG